MQCQSMIGELGICGQVMMEEKGEERRIYRIQFSIQSIFLIVMEFFEILSDLNLWYLITSQMRVKRVSRIHHQTILRVWIHHRTSLTLVCVWLGAAWFKSDKILTRLFRLAARDRLSLSRPLSFSSPVFLLSQTKNQNARFLYIGHAAIHKCFHLWPAHRLLEGTHMVNPRRLCNQ